MSSNKISFEDSLLREVIEAGKCVSCGTCVVVCPFACLDLTKDTPSLVKECKICGICAKVCPRYQWAMPNAETFVFGRKRKPEEEFGIYRRIAIAQATDADVLKVRQDGGVATALLLFAMNTGQIDGAIVAGADGEKPFNPAPILATTSKEIIAAAGTKYSCSPNVLGFTEMLKKKKSSIAFVGTPCQIHAVRRMQMAGLKRHTAPVKLLVGLMCSECFTYEGLMENHIHGKLGLDLDKISKINIKGKMLVTSDSGTTEIPLSEIKQYARKSCSFCSDFSSELADISVGGLGLEDFTFTIIRTEKGEELFSSAVEAGYLRTKPLDEGAFPYRLLKKLSNRKRGTISTS